VNEETKAGYTERARILKAMAHPSRLFIPDELSKEERCVRDLTSLIGADTSTVSKHLLLLKNAGIVAADKRGTQVYYRLKAPCVMNFFGCVEMVMRDNVTNQLRMLE
jgi:DNA-binding transcriptional ArsR family regulator